MPLALLKRLYSEHKDSDDKLNLIAAHLPGGLSVQQVQRLLQRHGLEEGAARKKGGPPEHRTAPFTMPPEHRHCLNRLLHIYLAAVSIAYPNDAHVKSWYSCVAF